jgi:ribonuclease-3
MAQRESDRAASAASEAKPVEIKSTEIKSTEPKSTESKSTESKSAERGSAAPKRARSKRAENAAAQKLAAQAAKAAAQAAKLAAPVDKPAAPVTKTAPPVAKPAAPADKPESPAKRRAAKKYLAASSELEKIIDYHFKDRDLLDRSLTHISAVSSGGRANSYQRLEFLGDHVLGLIISDMLFQSFPKADEGELSRRLADLVRREACADVARAMQIGEAIRLGSSEAASGGRARIAILADVCEALIGAVYLDGGYEASVNLVEKFWGERMRVPARPLRDPKTMLQEWAQARGLPTPAYKEVERTGPHHNPEFRISVTLPNREPAEGIGRSKRSAEQAAAAALLKQVGVLRDQPDV